MNLVIRLIFAWLLLISISVAAATLEDVKVLSEEYPPYNFLDRQGQLKGISVNLLIKAYAKAGVTLKRSHIKVQPWPRSYRQIQMGDNVMLFSMARTSQREQLFKWVGPITSSKTVLIAKKSNNIKVDDLSLLSNYRIGGVEKDIGIQIARRELEDRNLIMTNPYSKSLAKMLAIGRIDLWAYEMNGANLVFKQNAIDPNEFEAVHILSQYDLYYAFSLKTDQKIIDRLQKALDEVKNDY